MSQSPRQTLAVSHVMHYGVINTPPQTPLKEAAAEMAGKRVHCLVVLGLARGTHQAEELVWGILSDLDVVKAVAAGHLDVTAGEVAATEIVTVEECDSVEQAAQLMAEHECTHLLVRSRESGEPVGVISSLDIAGTLTRLKEFAQ